MRLEEQYNYVLVSRPSPFGAACPGLSFITAAQGLIYEEVVTNFLLMPRQSNWIICLIFSAGNDAGTLQSSETEPFVGKMGAER